MSLYSEIVKDITEKISTMEKGDKIPSERQLCKDYGVSRTTIRNAIGQLVNDGLIFQIQGKGSFVTGRDDLKDNLSNYYSFTQRTKLRGMSPNSEILDFRVKKASSNLAKAMGINKMDLVIEIIRLRLADNEPMMYETSFIPYERFRNVSKDLVAKKPLYEIFEDANAKIFTVNERFSVANLTKKIANFLGQRIDSPSLKVIRKSYDFEDRLLEYTISYARGDRFYYETSYNPR